MRSLRAETHDPSPSLWAYRLHRMWLTPVYRRIMRIGPPVVLLATAAVWYVSDEARITALTDGLHEMRRTFQERPEFMVEMLSIHGAAPDLSQAVREILPVNLPASSFDLDLEALKAEAESFDAVASARVRVRPGGVLQIDIEERVPALLWRTDDGLTLLDASGHRVADAGARTDFADLPVIAGTGADRAVTEALALIDAADPLADRLRGLERIGERRWDIVLNRRQRILLPESDAVQALERLIALHEVLDILERDLALVDLRNPHRPTLRLNGTAMAEFLQIRTLETTGASQ